MSENERISRRASLLKLGGLVAGAAGVGALASGRGLERRPCRGRAGLVACVLAPEQTEGPYYLDDHKVRRNITEGKPGAPLDAPAQGGQRVELQADQGGGGRHLALRRGRRVLGHGRPGNVDERFLRGIQRTDANGPRALPRRSIPAGTRAAPCTST